ncbi:MAG: ribonuclease HII [Myxococcota bacterium]
MKGTVGEIREKLPEISDRSLRGLAKDERAGVRDLASRELARRRAEREHAAAEAERVACMLNYERPLWQSGLLVAGCDEVGTGPLAGPVVAAAVILPAGTSIAGIDDSKKLDAPTRERLAVEIRACAVAFSIASCDVEIIDRLNIYHAALEAMRRAVTGLTAAPQHVLVDARRVPGLSCQQTPIVKGDSLSQSIAAAAILAKVHRDDLMLRYSEQYPGYGFHSHKGYSAPEHFAALDKLGPCAIHRRSFAPVAERLGLRPSPSAQLALGL